MHKRLLQDFDFRVSDNLPELPPKRMMYNKNVEFIQERQKLLNNYIKFLILIFEAIGHPILQRFLEIDTWFNPNYDYEPIDVGILSEKREDSDCSSLFLEMDKYMKTRFNHVLKGHEGPNNSILSAQNIKPIDVIHDIY